MEAHALTVRLTRPVPFPFLVLLVSGGHGLLALARGVDDFLLLGRTLDEAPGDTLDKVRGGTAGVAGSPRLRIRPRRRVLRVFAWLSVRKAVLRVDWRLFRVRVCRADGKTLVGSLLHRNAVARRLSLAKHPECSSFSGGQAIEHLAKGGSRSKFPFKPPMGQHLDCNFSFAGLRNQVTKAIEKAEQEEGVRPGEMLPCVRDVAAATQHVVAAHLAKRTHRAVLFCKAGGLLPEDSPALVVSGGVASNQYIRKILKIITDATGLLLLCPPSELCTDNGVMIAWNGIERLREGKGIMKHTDHVVYEPKAPFGIDITRQVKEAAIKLPRIKLAISD
ncbi:hypothetical protein Z043_118864 [Scleropages formosus]|uniref:N(6)-L-threonylcarbamoyladenine synthase n=1 Tax=Scleropages formosus TaxID=113540 RepID=A0A0P7WNX6_SCLFO|nr:hypothetical protein Z043_118864 [Scleropages formosus]